MFRSHAPSTVLIDRVHDFQAQLPGVFDGSEEAIHAARVAVRRVTEVLSLVRDEYDEHAVAAIEAQLAKAARALGRVRDADSGQRLIQEVEQRLPFAVATIGQLRLACSDRQYKSRRKAIKKLEALDLGELPQQLMRAWHRPSRRWPLAAYAWKTVMTRQIAERAEHLRTSIEHATGVYFSKRVHSARIAIKQLRYTLEFAGALGASVPSRSIRRLKKAQEVLGAAHDRDVLMDRLEKVRCRHAETINAVEADALCRLLRAESLALHQRYLGWRPELLEICGACTGARRGSTAARAVMIAGIGIPSLLLLRSSASARTE